MAVRYAKDLCAFQSKGPYYLGGYCFGGYVAYEMARYLEADLVFSTDGKPAAEISRHIDARLPRGGLHRISIDVPGAAHEVTVGFHLTNLAAQALRRLAASRPIMVVSDSHAAGRHIDPLIEALMSAGISAAVHLVPAGEAAKELRTLSAIYGALAEDGIDREGVLVSLGGGSVGDVAGFAAATWMPGWWQSMFALWLYCRVDG